MFACLLNYLPANLSILLLMVVKSLKSYLYYFSWKCIVFWYLYRSLISVQFSCIARHAFAWCAYIYHVVSCHLPDITLMSFYHLKPDMLLLDTCSLLWHDLSLASCHINTWPMIIIFTGILYQLSCIIYCDLLSCFIYIQWPEFTVLMYS